MTTEKRIRLAKAMGWHKSVSLQGGFQGKGEPKFQTDWFDANNNFQERLPDPWHSAEDCEALIRWLNEYKNIGVVVMLAGGTGTKDVVHVGRNKWLGDDWKTGVCELALKVIEGTSE